MSKERELLERLVSAELNDIFDLLVEAQELLAQPKQQVKSNRVFYQEGYAQAELDLKREPLSDEEVIANNGFRLKAQEAKATAQKLTAHASAFPRDAKAGDASRRAWKDYAKANSHLASMELAQAKLDLKRKPLSAETIAKLWGESYSGTTQMVLDFARAIEKAHGIGGGE
jgi:hypothetical protein